MDIRQLKENKLKTISRGCGKILFLFQISSDTDV